MRVSFDSNAWEAAFGFDTPPYAIREALMARRIEGFVCEAAFRIEAVRKQNRPGYFARPKMEVNFPGGIIDIDGKPHLHLISLRPDDAQHPGLPKIQSDRWQAARSAGVRFMRGLAWMGLPSPPETRAPEDFIPETASNKNEREQRQIAVSAEIWKRGVGKQAFDDAGGWQAIERGNLNLKKFAKACAEWADGELAAAHIAYGNDILCTNDYGVASGRSIFDAANRSWLAMNYGVRFATLEELAGMIRHSSKYLE